MEVGIEFKQYKHKMMQAAKELCYSDKVIERIKHAKTVDEIGSIMRTARIKKEYEELGPSRIDCVRIKKGK